MQRIAAERVQRYLNGRSFDELTDDEFEIAYELLDDGSEYYRQMILEPMRELMKFLRS